MAKCEIGKMSGDKKEGEEVVYKCSTLFSEAPNFFFNHLKLQLKNPSHHVELPPLARLEGLLGHDL
jgi:hypothetical protein